MNAPWVKERIISVLINTASLLEKHESNYALDQILYDSLRIYSSTASSPKSQDLTEILQFMERNLKEDDSRFVFRAMELIKANPKNIISLLEKFERNNFKIHP